MKLVSLVILTCFLTPFQVSAQSFAPKGAEWFYSAKKEVSGPPNTKYLHIESVKDTTIKSQAVQKISKKLVSKDDTVKRNPLYFYQTTDTIFFYSKSRSDFLPYFIYNVQEGDTVRLGVPDRLLADVADRFLASKEDSSVLATITTIKMDTFDGIRLKRYGVRTIFDTGLFFSFPGIFIESIGPSGGFLPTIEPSTGAIIGPLRCYSDTSINVQLSDEECTYLRSTTGVKKTGQKAPLKIYPNPTHKQLRIQTNQPIAHVSIQTLGGKQLTVSDSRPINVSNLELGTYIIIVQFDSGKQVYRRFIKR